MNDLRFDKSTAFLEGSSSIPTRSGCFLKMLPPCLRSDRTGAWIYFIPVCIVFVAYLCLVCPACLYASDNLSSLDYETAAQKGKETQRPLLLFFTSPWCYQCTEMERKVFKNKDIISTLNEQFLLAEVDISQEKKLKEDFLINYTPTSLFLDVHGKPIINVKGYIPTNRFRKLLRYVSEGHYQTTPFSKFEKQ